MTTWPHIRTTKGAQCCSLVAAGLDSTTLVDVQQLTIKDVVRRFILSHPRRLLCVIWLMQWFSDSNFLCTFSLFWWTVRRNNDFDKNDIILSTSSVAILVGSQLAEIGTYSTVDRPNSKHDVLVAVMCRKRYGYWGREWRRWSRVVRWQMTVERTSGYSSRLRSCSNSSTW